MKGRVSMNGIFGRTLAAVVLLAGLLSSGAGWAQDMSPIRIGVTVSLSGQYEEFGNEQLNGLSMWVEDVNGRGALLGRPVELVTYDDGSDPKQTVDLYEKLINVDKVDLLIGPYSSELTLVASEVAEKYQFPMVATAASAELIWSRGLKNIFGIDTPSGSYMDPAIKLAMEKGDTRIALVYADLEFSRDVAKGIRALGQEMSLQLVLDEPYADTERDFEALAQRVKAANPQVVLGASYFDDSVALVKALRAAGVNPNMMAFTVGPALKDFGDALGSEADSVLGVVQWLRDARQPKAQDFAFRYRSMFNVNPGVHGAIGYSAGQVTEAAVRLAGSLDKDAVRGQLGSMLFRSLIGYYQVDASGRQTGKRNYLLQWQDNRRRLVKPDTLADTDLIYPMMR